LQETEFQWKKFDFWSTLKKQTVTEYTCQHSHLRPDCLMPAGLENFDITPTQGYGPISYIADSWAIYLFKHLTALTDNTFAHM